jgi:hypothetical protein
MSHQEPSGLWRTPAKRRGRLARMANLIGGAGVPGLHFLWGFPAIFMEGGMPGIPWPFFVLLALLPFGAMLVYWWPVYRVPQCTFHTGFAAVMTGVGGAGWHVWAAPIMSALTILGLILAPRDGGWKVQWPRYFDDERVSEGWATSVAGPVRPKRKPAREPKCGFPKQDTEIRKRKRSR